jgi:AcrR family transcriptional regulator
VASRPARHDRTDDAAAPLVSVVAGRAEAVSHNLAGQKLGRKGRDTRERILAAALELIEERGEAAFSMSAVARRASLGITSLYNYFADLTELALAVLEPVMETAEDAYLAMLRERWSDDDLGDRCFAFVHAYHWFWARNSRLLHMRNAMADALDSRLMRHRIASTQPIIEHLVRQMGGDIRHPTSLPVSMATMTMIGIERSITIATDRHLPMLVEWNFKLDDDRFVRPGARLLELAIREARATGAA